MSEETRSLVERLRRRLHRTVRRLTLGQLCFGLVLTLGAAAALWLTVAAAEAGLWMSSGLRTALMAVVGVGVAALFGVYVAGPLLRLSGLIGRPSDEDAARQVGRHFPERVADRFVNLLQLAGSSSSDNGDDSSNPLADRAVTRLGREVEAVDFEDMEDFSRARRASRWAALPVAGLLVFLLAAPNTFLGASGRLLAPTAHFQRPAPFQLSLSPGEADLVEGDSLTVIVRAQPTSRGADLPSTVTLQAQADGSEHVEEFTLSPADAGGTRFRYVFTGAREDFRYRAAAEANGRSLRTAWREARVRTRPAVSRLQLTLDPPAYSDLPERERPPGAGDVSALPGTEVTVEAQLAGPDVSRALLRFSPSGDVDTLSVEDGTAQETFTLPPEPSRYHLALTSEDGAQNADPIEYRLQPTSDAAPTVSLTAPAPDAALTDARRPTLRWQMSDDFGFAAQTLYWRRTERAHGDAMNDFQSVDVPVGRPGLLDQQVAYDWLIEQTTGMDLTSGDVIEYYVRVWDNNRVAGYQSARTQTRRLRLPSTDEQYEQLDETQQSASEQMKRLEEQSDETQRQFDHLRESLRRKREGDWEDQRQVEQLQKRRQQLQQGAKQLTRQIEKAARQMQKDELASPQTQQAYKELQRVARQLQSPKMKKALQNLQKAMQEMDMKNMQQSLENFQSSEKQYRRQLERTQELLEKLKTQQQLDEVAKRAGELAEEEKRLAEETEKLENEGETERGKEGEEKSSSGEQKSSEGKPSSKEKNDSGKKSDGKKQSGEQKPSSEQAGKQSDEQKAGGKNQQGKKSDAERKPGGKRNRRGAQQSKKKNAEQREQLAQEQEQARKKMKTLRKKMQKLSKQMKGTRGAPRKQMQQMQQRTRQMPQQMKQNSRKLRQGQMKKARQGQRRMQKRLQQMQQSMRQMQKGMQRKSKRLNMTGIRQALANTLRLSEGQEALRKRTGGLAAGSPALREVTREQNRLAESLRTTRDSLTALAKDIPKMTRKVQKEAGEALRAMSKATEAMTGRNAQPSGGHQKTAMKNLNELALLLSNLLDQMKQSQGSGSKGGGMSMKQMRKQLKNIGGQQKKLNGQVQQMLNQMQGKRLSQGQSQRLNQMAQKQKAIRKKLQKMRKQGADEKTLGDLEKVADQMQETIRQMQRGRLDRETLERQQQIRSRLLQARQSLQKRGRKNQRRGREADDDRTRAQPASSGPPGQQNETEQLRRSLIRSLESGYAPDYERLIKRYFERLKEQQQ